MVLISTWHLSGPAIGVYSGKDLSHELDTAVVRGTQLLQGMTSGMFVEMDSTVADPNRVIR